jgi:hypothetical protein
MTQTIGLQGAHLYKLIYSDLVVGAELNKHGKS